MAAGSNQAAQRSQVQRDRLHRQLTALPAADPERQAWFDGFAHVLDGAKLSASLASPGYGEHGSGRVARTHVSPVQMSAEEVM